MFGDYVRFTDKQGLERHGFVENFNIHGRTTLVLGSVTKEVYRVNDDKCEVVLPFIREGDEIIMEFRDGSYGVLKVHQIYWKVQKFSLSNAGESLIFTFREIYDKRVKGQIYTVGL